MPSNKKLLQAAAGNAGGGALYAEDVFSTYLYTGEGAGTTITNGIDLADAGGLVWAKNRGTANGHYLLDTASNGALILQSNTTGAGIAVSPPYMVAQSTGYTTGGADSGWNGTGQDMVSWTFRKAEKFFDVVTYTGNSTAGRTVAHNLGSVPACIIIKRTDGTSEWPVYHKDESSYGTTGQYEGRLNETSDFGWDYISGTPTDSVFAVTGDTAVNLSGATYVAYLFASDAGGFGDDGDESIIKCGSYTGDGGAGTTEVNLGFEPQWILVKATSAADNWFIIDNMRGWATESNTSNDAVLLPNTSNAESTGGYLDITATGFKTTLFSNVNVSGRTYAYVAIRRPMKTPESGTEVFNLSTASAGTDITNNFAADLWFGNNTSGDGGNDAHTFASRLTGLKWLQTATTSAEFTASNTFYWDSNTEFTNSQFGGSRVEYFLKRATGCFDVVAFSGSSILSERTYNHNLGVQPELIIIKGRSGSYASGDWNVATNQGAKNGESIDTTKNHTGFQLNATNGITFGTSQNWSDVCSTTTFTTNGAASYITNSSGNTIQWSAGTDFIAYLFATLAGVSKVGSYTGTNTTNNIDCGFSSSARFILIKRTDSTGDWYFWDSARGITVGNDPYLVLNTTAAQLYPGSDVIQPYSSGFTLTNNAGSGINGNGGTYIFLAIA